MKCGLEGLACEVWKSKRDAGMRMEETDKKGCSDEGVGMKRKGAVMNDVEAGMLVGRAEPNSGKRGTGMSDVGIGMCKVGGVNRVVAGMKRGEVGVFEGEVGMNDVGDWDVYRGVG